MRRRITLATTTLTPTACSICYRYGAEWAYCSRSTASVSCDPDALVAYSWGDKSLEFYNCRHCGCLTLYESIKKLDDSRIAVNARMIPPEDVVGTPVRTFDGRSTWMIELLRVRFSTHSGCNGA